MVVIGSSGVIGRRLVEVLQARGHDALAAAPSSGVDILTGRGLLAVLRGAQVVIDVASSRSFAGDALRSFFFETSTRNMLASGIAADIQHYVALALVPAQARLVESAHLPYTVLRAHEGDDVDELAEALANVAEAAPRHEVLSLDDALLPLSYAAAPRCACARA